MYCFHLLGQRISQAKYPAFCWLLGLFFNPKNGGCAQNTGKFLPIYMDTTSLERVLFILTAVRTSNPIRNNSLCVRVCGISASSPSAQDWEGSDSHTFHYLWPRLGSESNFLHKWKVSTCIISWRCNILWIQRSQKQTAMGHHWNTSLFFLQNVHHSYSS
jgi:hypothetical protein